MYSIQYDSRYNSYLTKYKTSDGSIIKAQFTKKYHGVFAYPMADHFRRTGEKLVQWSITDGETVARYTIKNGIYYRILISKTIHTLLKNVFISIREKEQGLTSYAYVLVNGKQFFLHRFIMNTPDNLQVDHINHDGLDNRIENLRNTTVKINNRNKQMLNKASSGFQNIEDRNTSFRITVRDDNGKRINHSIRKSDFNSEEEALKYAIEVRDYYIDKYYERQSAAKPLK